MALDLGGLTPILWSFIERDEIVDMLASLTGQRMLFNYFRIGGVNGDLNHEFMSRLGDWMSHATEQIEAGKTLLNENEIFVRRMRGLGTIDSTTALRMAMTGPNLRATGVPFDVRRAHPYSVYPELDFDIPTRSEGDCLARYLLRMDEIKQSLRIIDQCLHQMPDGPIMAKLPRLLRPRPGGPTPAIEAPRGQYADVRHQRRHRPAVPDAHPRPVVHPPPGGRPDDRRATSSPTPWPSWRASTRSWAASTSDRSIGAEDGRRSTGCTARHGQGIVVHGRARRR